MFIVLKIPWGSSGGWESWPLGGSLVCTLMPSDDCEPHIVLEEAMQSVFQEAYRRLPHKILSLRVKGHKWWVSWKIGEVPSGIREAWGSRERRWTSVSWGAALVGRAQDLSRCAVGLQTPLSHWEPRETLGSELGFPLPGPWKATLNSLLQLWGLRV